jgi:hypothetical protein
LGWTGVLATASLLLALPPPVALEPATPDTSDIGCPVAALLLHHRNDLAKAAAAHGIPGVVLAGVPHPNLQAVGHILCPTYGETTATLTYQE